MKELAEQKWETEGEKVKETKKRGTKARDMKVREAKEKVWGRQLLNMTR